jgi:predicted dehydrogenase
VGIGIIGQGVRGTSLQSIFHRPEINSVVRVLCDPNQQALDAGKAQFDKNSRTNVETDRDLRRVFDRKDIDAVVICPPNHWHTLAAIWALEAGKHVYLEKPATHNVWEGKQLTQAIQKTGGIVQHGVQLRSSEALREAVQKMREGEIGDVYMARAVIFRDRGNIGPKKVTSPPAYLDWDLYRGPSTVDEYVEDLIKNQHWHNFWTYGGGDLTNQGVHEVDCALWGLGLDSLPDEVTAAGGNFLWEDAKEVPEILNANCLYKEKRKLVDIAVRNWCTNFEDDVFTGNIFYGSKGVLLIFGYQRYKVIMGLGKDRKPGRWIDSGDPLPAHGGNFLDAVRSRDTGKLHAPIASGLASCNTCHLTNIAFRTGEKVRWNASDGQLVAPQEAAELLRRQYREGYAVPDLGTEA